MDPVQLTQLTAEINQTSEEGLSQVGPPSARKRRLPPVVPRCPANAPHIQGVRPLKGGEHFLAVWTDLGALVSQSTHDGHLSRVGL